ncbi:hypothetical protein GCM10009737_12670 [Nocardioides lentus]|uniref:PspA-associated domain-containing protein n=1 Tax=Nocardioides lentus TaxID=338077 RepID=A0ABP5AFJ9_9ACTN
MIIRILGEGQFDVADEHLDRLNELDEAVEAAVEADDVATFTPALEALLDAVRSHASPHAPDALDASDLILPPADADIAEVREMLADDGLIPG